MPTFAHNHHGRAAARRESTQSGRDGGASDSGSASDDEGQGLLPQNQQLALRNNAWQMGLSKPQFKALCTISVLLMIAVVYWTMDSWNRSSASTLFDAKVVEVDRNLRVHMAQGFANPLLLTVLQFAFMSAAFLFVWVLCSGHTAVSTELRAALMHKRLADKRFASLAACHAFSTFWLQSLMMPGTMMSLGGFAALRAMEIPMAAVLRHKLLDGAPFGRRTLMQASLAFLGAWLVVYSYATIGNCLCIWTGSGVPLTGAALYLVWFSMLAIPAAHAVLEEGAIKQAGFHPMAVLALQNLTALAIGTVVLGVAHLVGLEDVSVGLSTLLGMDQIRMLVLWLCVQMCLLSAARVGFTCIANSFWSVSLRALKAAFTWFCELALITIIASHGSLSLSHPHASVWSFMMLLGLLVVVAAAYVDISKDLPPRMRNNDAMLDLDSKAMP